MAAVFSKEDTLGCHLEDTLKAKGGLCDEKVVSLLVNKGLERIRDLIALGVSFDGDTEGLSLPREEAHRRERI